MSSNYRHVSCATHSELELMIMHGEKLELNIIQNSRQQNILLEPYDLLTRKDKGEYLLGKGEHGKLVEIRLDKIIAFRRA